MIHLLRSRKGLKSATRRVRHVARETLRGLQDTYVFTMAMGEQILSPEKNDVPMVTIRASIVEGAFVEPLIEIVPCARLIR